MVARFVTVGDDLTLPAVVKAADANLPAASRAAAIAAKANAVDVVPKWKTATAYLAGDKVVSPNGDVVSSIADHTSGVSFTAGNWNLSASYATPASVASTVAADATLARRADTGIPQVVNTESDADYYAGTLDTAGNLVEATDQDGIKVLPRVRIASTKVEEIAVGPENPWLKGSVDTAGNLAEDTLDLSGKVPAAILTAWKTRMGTVNADPIDILIVAGQSNATERSSLPVSVADTDPRILRWNQSSGLMEQVSASAVEWIGSGFAREYVKNVPNRRVLIVPAALGSTGFTTTSVTPPAAGYTYVSGGGTWDRNLTADPVNLPAQLITKTQGALAAAGSGARIVGMLWSQGESDRGAMTQAAYAAAVDDLFSYVRTTLALPTLPIVIGSMTPETIWDGGSTTQDIHKAILDTPRRVVNTSYVWGPPNMVEYLNSRVHWSPQGQAQRARVMATDGLYRARLNVTAANPVQPQNLRITRSGTAVSINWDAPPARVTAYALEMSTDSGTTWVAQTLVGPIITEHQATATATLPVWVRAKSTNEVGTSDWTREAKA